MSDIIETSNINDDLVGHVRRAYEGIRRMMFHNELVPGQKISYRDLSDRLGMSQTPIIQALKWLEFQQLVRHEPNRGYYTAPIDTKEVEEIYDLRELIELSLLPRTLERIDADGILRLEAVLNEHLAAAKEIYLYDRLQKDMSLHLTLAQLSGCGVQHQTLRNLFDLLYLKYGGNILFSTSMKSADIEHGRLFEAICARDLKSAKKILISHIRRVKDHVLAGLANSRQAKDTIRV